MASSSQSASLTSRCIARTLPPSTCRAIGSMDLRARGLNCPTIELKNWSRGSCRVKHARKAVWDPRSSSIKASISLRVSANWGMANGSSAVRQAGNIFCLLVLLLVYGNRYQENGHVSIFRCRCRGNHADFLLEGLFLGEGDGLAGMVREYERAVFDLNVQVERNMHDQPLNRKSTRLNS